MRYLASLAIGMAFISIVGCRSAATPVAIGEKPVAVNGRQMKDAQSRPWKPVTEMGWTGFNDRVTKVKDLKGRVVILDFWATYCEPCIRAIPHLRSLKAQYGDQLEVIGLHVGGEEDRAKVPEFVERLSIDYPLGTPEDALSAYIFGTDTAIPQTAILDRNGTLVKKFVGFNDEIQQQLDAALAETIADGK
ncbi:TlpA family protein disulfide reductase [Leptolyngbya sp. 7M]|uniref:TlpA family protein disulfide reductase n=1 Tax=Leptolyngbya sp. 7M TaxID=2812896 RepID=UPI001B8AB4E8|nr:TlpA disulfide reductase family protein [Leptolyngbya sp. 7M]QYO67029.1 TlpA family protein disulfide reductase [Leptolyngbya sp. 7M]